MSTKRFVLFIAVSGALHMLGFALLMFFSDPTEKIYESIEVTSYITPIVKPNESRLEKRKYEKLNELADKSKEISDEERTPLGGTSHEDIAQALAEESQITTPVKLLTKIKANRTDSARKADYSGTSVVELVVGSNGEVKDAKLSNHLEHGLDDVALDIAKDLKFKPAMIGDKAVATRVNLKIKFTSVD